MNQTQKSTPDPTPTLRVHTRDRWIERAPVDNPIPLEQAWSDAIKVPNPVSWASEVRLYAPYDVLLAQTWNESDTVLHVDFDRLDTASLIECESCELLTDPWLDTDECHWCGAPLTGTRADGRLRIRRAGGR